MSVIANVAAFVVGVVIIQAVLRSAIRTVVVPRNEQVLLSRLVFLFTRPVFALSAKRQRSAVKRHAVMARFAPTTLIGLAIVWVFVVFVGFVPIYWAVGSISLHEAVLLSGSSITTLGFVAARTDPTSSVAYVEAIIGLGLLAMLISYLPTIYGHFSKREAEVVKLESRAGTPPWSGTMIRRYNSIGWLDRMGEAWPAWQQWFVEIQESHTSQLALPLFRSQDHAPARWSSDRDERFRPPTLFHPSTWQIEPLTNPPSW